MTDRKTPDDPKVKRRNNRGIALVFSLLGITVLSLLAAALLFVSNQETYAALNYQRQVQSVYASTAAVQTAVDWFRNTYGPYLDNQTTGVADTAAYVLTAANPTYSGAAVTLGGTGANFPNTTIKTSFNTMRVPSSAITIGNASMTYTMAGTLLSHKRYKDVTGNNVLISERWQLAVTGSIGTTSTYSVQEIAIIERFFIPIFKDAIRGQCDVNVSGNVTTDSFNSQSGCKSPPCSYGGSNLYTGADAGASVGSNAVLVLTGGSITVNGNAYYGQSFGSCTGTDKIPSGDVKGTITEAPAVPFPPITPTFTTTTGGSSVCSGTPTFCNPSSCKSATNYFAYPPNTTGTYYGNCNPASGDVAALCVPKGATAAQPYFFTDISLGGGKAELDLLEGDSTGVCDSTSKACSAPGASCAPVKLYVSNSFALGGNGLANTNGDPTKFTVLITKDDKTDDNACDWGGNAPFYGTIYSPNAACNMHGTGDLYGAVSAWNVDAKGNFNVHYDLALSSQSGYVTAFRIVNQTRAVF